METISILTPSRGRPRELELMLQSALDTAHRPSHIEFLTAIDTDDPAFQEYQNIEKSEKQRFASATGLTVSELWNVLAQLASGTLLMMSNDDLRFRITGWDTELREKATKYPDRIFCLWFLDGIATPDSWPRFPCVSREWVKTLGYFAPTMGFRFFYNDTWIGDLANRVGRSILVSNKQYLDHRHHSVTGTKDETTKRARRNNANIHDQTLFAQTNHIRARDAELLNKRINQG